MVRIKTLLLLVLFVVVVHPAWATTFPYGKTGKIDYDLKSGTFSVSDRTEQLLKNGFSTVKNGTQLLSSKDYAQRKYSKTPFQDGFGKGTKHVILLTGKGLPDMKQVFYTYDHLTYFLCEVSVEGKQVSSNELVPIQGVVPFLQQNADLRSVFVPFDNDTFIRYDSKVLTAGEKQTSAEVGVLYDNVSRKGLVTGSVTHEIWKTGVKTGRGNDGVLSLLVQAGFSEAAITRDTIAHGALTGTKVNSAKIFFGAFADWRTGLDNYGKANRIAEPPVVVKWDKPTPVGWNSWGVMQDRINYEKATQVVDFFADSLKGFRNEGVAYIDLDSYWDKMIKGGLEGDFSELKAFADYTKKRGLKPGVYWAPFTDWGFHSGADRRAEGGKYKFGEMWTKVGKGYHDIDGARALDPTHPGTQQRIDLVIGKLKACGFEMIKIDFLGHAAIESDHFYDQKVKTGMQAYKIGMEYLLKALDGKMMVYAAISPSLASGKYVHVRRIACDAFKSIKDTEYTLNSLTYGWWQTHLYDYVDADHVVLHDETEGANRARTLSAVIIGTIISGDDFSIKGQWGHRAQQLFQNPALLAVIKDGKSFSPVDADRGAGASQMFVKHAKEGNYVAVFNYDGAEQKFLLDLERLGFPANGSYELTELFSGKTETLKNKDAFTVPAGDAKIFKLSVKGGK